MKKHKKTPYVEYFEKSPDNDKDQLSSFFHDFELYCLLNSFHKMKMREDFEKAILFYIGKNIDLKTALFRLDLTNLGGFYARESSLWFPLDDAAKLYPVVMRHGEMSVFRLAMYLEEDIVPELLQIALHFTIKRFPSFATTLKKGIFWHYLDSSKRRFYIECENNLPCTPINVSKTHSQAFRVLYFENRISVEYFHVLTDGTGGMAFLKALVLEYLRLLGVEKEVDNDLLDINVTPKLEEIENKFLSINPTKSTGGFVDKNAIQLSGKLSNIKPCRVLHFKMDTQKLKELCNQYNVTVTTFIIGLIMMASKASTDVMNGDISVQVPVNMRKFYKSNTVRNFSLYCGIRKSIDKIDSFDELLSEIKIQLEEKTNLEAMSGMLRTAKKLVKSINFIPLIIKSPLVKLVYSFLSESLFTTTFSNLGLVTLPEKYKKYIKSMDFVLGTAIKNRVSLSMVSYNNISTLSIAKQTLDPSFEDRLYELLSSFGLSVLVEGSVIYES